jgi:hypothetical protein
VASGINNAFPECLMPRIRPVEHASERDLHREELEERNREERRMSEQLRHSEYEGISTADLDSLSTIREITEQQANVVDDLVDAEAHVDLEVSEDAGEAPPASGDPHLDEATRNFSATLRQRVLAMSRATKTSMQSIWQKHGLKIGLALTNTVVSSAVSVVTSLLMYVAQGKRVQRLRPEQEALICEEIERWRNEPETEFWTRMGKLAERLKLSIEAQIYMNQLTKAICVQASFPWPSTSAKTAAMNELFDAYLERASSADMYAFLASEKWRFTDPATKEATPYPRCTSVELLGLGLDKALSFIDLQKSKQQEKG